MSTETYEKQYKVLNYSEEKYPFTRIIADYLETDELELLNYHDSEVLPSVENSFYKNMEQSVIFKKLYQNLYSSQGSRFYDVYKLFIEDVIRPQYNEPIYYQNRPSHRILFRDLKGTARYHRDSDYGHKVHEINYWVPQTDAYDSNSIWISEDVDKNAPDDHKAVTINRGQYLRFPGATLSHGAVANTTNKTRVSFDFRIIPASLADEITIAEAAIALTDGENPIQANAQKFVLCE